MPDYKNAKPSFLLEDQLPKYVRANGQKFILFLKSYYEWIEKKNVILTLKSSNSFPASDIVGQRLSPISRHYQFLTEEDEIIADENIGTVTDVEYQNSTQSLVLNGIDQHGIINHDILNINNSWTLIFWARVSDLPSTVRLDYDLITLSNTEYMSAVKISKDANEIQAVWNGTTLKTGIYVYKNIWNLFCIRYDATTKKIYYDVFNEFDEMNSYESSLDLSGLTSNMFVVGCDLYNSRNFYDGYIDEIATWNEVRTDTDIISIYNNGNPTNLLDSFNDSSFNTLLTSFDDIDIIFDHVSNGIIISNYIKFDTGNSSVAFNSIDNYNDLYIYHSPSYSIEVPINTSAFTTENEEINSLVVDVNSTITYENVPEGVLGNRYLAFCDHITGKLQTDIPIYVTPEGMEVVIESYIDVRSPINVINDIQNYQEIDYSLSYGNYVYNSFFENAWKEIMFGFPIYIKEEHETSIKNIIAKTIRDFYESKGTLKSIKYLFKILYNEDLIIGQDLYSSGSFQYTIKTQYASAQNEILEVLNLVAHPVGFGVQIIQK